MMLSLALYQPFQKDREASLENCLLRISIKYLYLVFCKLLLLET